MVHNVKKKEEEKETLFKNNILFLGKNQIPLLSWSNFKSSITGRVQTHEGQFGHSASHAPRTCGLHGGVRM